MRIATTIGSAQLCRIHAENSWRDCIFLCCPKKGRLWAGQAGHPSSIARTSLHEICTAESSFTGTIWKKARVLRIISRRRDILAAGSRNSPAIIWYIPAGVHLTSHIVGSSVVDILAARFSSSSFSSSLFSWLTRRGYVQIGVRRGFLRFLKLN